tara:strand:- start:1918 stop:3411 length:1494 start_codon:yes stop_codon:yes gene_type:complete
MSTLRQQATAAMKKGQYEQAAELYTTLLADSDVKHVLWSNRSKAYYDAGNFQAAVADARACIAAQPDYHKGYWRLGQACEALAQYEAAFHAYLRILKYKGVREALQRLDVTDVAVSTLMTHIRETGGTMCASVVATDNQHVRGVIVLEDVRTGTDVIRVPWSALLTEEAGRATPWGQQIVGKTRDIPYDFVLHLVFAVVQRLLNNPNDPYLVSLPSDYSYMSAFWGAREFEQLRGSHIVQQVRKRQQLIADEYAFLTTHAPDFVTQCSSERYAHFRTMVSSRNFTFERHGQRQRALVPLADFVNHSAKPNTEWLFDDAAECFCVRARDDIHVGDTLCDSYGPRNNATLMSVYGFALPDNPYDYVHCDGLYLFRDPRCALARQHFDEWRSRVWGHTPKLREISLLQEIRARASRHLLEYKSTCPEDQEWLDQHPGPSVERFIRIATLSEKNILCAWIEIANECLRGDRSPRQLKKAKRRWKKESHGERGYLKHWAKLC